MGSEHGGHTGRADRSAPGGHVQQRGEAGRRRHRGPPAAVQRSWLGRLNSQYLLSKICVVFKQKYMDQINAMVNNQKLSSFV